MTPAADLRACAGGLALLAAACASTPETHDMLECAAMIEVQKDRKWMRELALEKQGIQPFPVTAFDLEMAVVGRKAREIVFKETNEFGSPENEGFGEYTPSNEALEAEIWKVKSELPSDISNEELYSKLAQCSEALE